MSLSMLATWPVSSTLALLAVFAAINRFANCAFFVTVPSALASIMEPGRAAKALAMSMTGWDGGLSRRPATRRSTHGFDRRGGVIGHRAISSGHLLCWGRRTDRRRLRFDVEACH